MDTDERDTEMGSGRVWDSVCGESDSVYAASHAGVNQMKDQSRIKGIVGSDLDMNGCVLVFRAVG